MKIPVAAFADVHAKDLPLGSLLKFRESWAMLVGYEDDRLRELLMLEGEHAGRLFGIKPGMPKCIALTSPFSWFPAIEAGEEAANVDWQTRTLAITNIGPVLVGADLEDRSNKYRAFQMNGMCYREYSSDSPRYVRWSAELASDNEPYKSLGQLFFVSADEDRGCR